MIFGRKKSQDISSGKKKNKKDTGGGKILKAIGLEAERAPEESEVEKQERHAKIVLAWKYLRDRIDKGTVDYLQNGSDAILREHVQRPALDTLLEHLRRLREQNIMWSQPDRSVLAKSEIEVVSEKLNSRGQPVSFVVRESFLDNSLLQGPGGAERKASGDKRTIQATVDVENGQEFHLVSVLEVKGKTI